MRTVGLMTGALALILLGTGCATKKYVAKSIAPVEQRVSANETKNTEQDKQIAAQGTQLEEVNRDLSRTKEKLTDTDAKAMRADQDAKAAQQQASAAQQSADTAKQAADNAHTFAEQGINKLDQTVQDMNKFHMVKSETVLFGVNQSQLTQDAKDQLGNLSREVTSQPRYVIQVQAFTDGTGDATYNDTLSQQRAQAVARYLATQSDVQTRAISVIGLGYAKPVGDDKTRDGRKMNRRAEVTVWVPDTEGTKTASVAAAQ